MTAADLIKLLSRHLHAEVKVDWDGDLYDVDHEFTGPCDDEGITDGAVFTIAALMPERDADD